MLGSKAGPGGGPCRPGTGWMGTQGPRAGDMSTHQGRPPVCVLGKWAGKPSGPIPNSQDDTGMVAVGNCGSHPLFPKRRAIGLSKLRFCPPEQDPPTWSSTYRSMLARCVFAYPHWAGNRCGVGAAVTAGGGGAVARECGVAHRRLHRDLPDAAHAPEEDLLTI